MPNAANISLNFAFNKIITNLLLFTNCRYESGDHVAVYPVNDPQLVEAIGTRLDVDLGTCFTLTNVDGM